MMCKIGYGICSVIAVVGGFFMAVGFLLLSAAGAIATKVEERYES